VNGRYPFSSSRFDWLAHHNGTSKGSLCLLLRDADADIREGGRDTVDSLTHLVLPSFQAAHGTDHGENA